MPRSLLFHPIRIGGLELAGRLVKSATVESCCTDDGFVTKGLIEYYEQIARGNTPLLITGSAYFDRHSKALPRQLAVDDDDKIPGLRGLVDVVHRYGSRIFMQVSHVGRQALPRVAGRTDAIAPSAVFEPSLGVRPREITRAEIRSTIYEFARAAGRTREAGFDGVQLHAAHGYLISSFLTPHTNRRTDEYGGSLENRMRFLVETHRAVRQVVGREFPVILKLNGSDDLPLRNGLKPEDLVTVARRMATEGIDAIEISAGHYESGFTFERGRWKNFFSTMTTSGMGRRLPWHRRRLMTLLAPILDRGFGWIAGYSEGFNLRHARLFKHALDIPVICVGGFAHREAMEQALANNECDMVAVARALIADPFLYRHMQSGVVGPKCDFCNACFARAGVTPVDCHNDGVRARRERMLREGPESRRQS